MGELAGSIAHEINQPLASVVTNAQAAPVSFARSHSLGRRRECRLTSLRRQARERRDRLNPIGVAEGHPSLLNCVLTMSFVKWSHFRDATRKRRRGRHRTRLDVPPVLADRVAAATFDQFDHQRGRCHGRCQRPAANVDDPIQLNKELQVEVAVIDVGSGIDQSIEIGSSTRSLRRADGMGMVWRFAAA